MNDLLSEMASDSDSGESDKLDKLDDGRLGDIARLANDAAELEAQISKAEELLKEKKRWLKEITEGRLPDALEALGLQKFTLTDGAEISVKPFYAASIPVPRRMEAFQWLRDHEFGDIVKNNVTVTFGRGEDEIAREFVSLCGSRGFVPSQVEKVEPSVLKAWLRERVEAGDPIPLDLFGAFISQRATIKRGIT